MKTTILYRFALCLLLICSLACNNDKTDTLDGESHLTKYRISNEKAITAINAYAENVKQIKGDSAHNMIYGTKVLSLVELRRILIEAENVDDSLYVMLAKMESGDTEMIFSLKTIKIDSEKVETPKWSFYDFTQPCPAACPEIPGLNF